MAHETTYFKMSPSSAQWYTGNNDRERGGGGVGERLQRLFSQCQSCESVDYAFNWIYFYSVVIFLKF